MGDIKNNIYSAVQVRELDRIAIEDFKIPGFTLMQRAAEATFHQIPATWPQAKNITVLVGNGNNGGDGYVVATLARAAGFTVQLLQVGDHSKLKGDAKKAYELFLEHGGVCEVYEKHLPPTDVMVDALLGTGLTRDVKGEYANVIAQINQHQAAVLSVDIPSGLHADTGCPMGSAVCADKTVTFVGMKLGLLTGEGPAHSGTLVFDQLQIPNEVYQSMQTTCQKIDLTELRTKLGKRNANAHKGNFGHVLVVGGNTGMAGAVMLAAEAAARTGSGLVSVATIPEHATAALQSCREIMVHGVDSVAALESLLKQASVVAIGPGLGQNTWATNLLARILEFDLPMVIDADALNLLASEAMQKTSWILTPHPGEAARLLACTTKEVQQDRLQAIRELQKKYGGTVVLKGSGSLIASTNDVAICEAGNPGMASGGMGDVLTGVIAGLLAQGLNGYDAARFGVQLHAESADVAAKDGMRGMLASDLFAPLRKLINA